MHAFPGLGVPEGFLVLCRWLRSQWEAGSMSVDCSIGLCRDPWLICTNRSPLCDWLLVAEPKERTVEGWPVVAISAVAKPPFLGQPAEGRRGSAV